MTLLFKTLAGAFLVFLGIAGVSYMQKRFDDGDKKKALEAVLAKIPGLRDGKDAKACRAEMASRVKGDVRVVCGNRAWIVNVLEAKIAEERVLP